MLDKLQNLNDISTWLLVEATRRMYYSSLSYYSPDRRKFTFYFDNDSKNYKIEVILWSLGILAGFFTFFPDVVGVLPNVPYLANILISGFMKFIFLLVIASVGIGIFGLARWLSGEESQFKYRIISPFEYYRQYKKSRQEFDNKILRLEKEIAKREKILKYLEDTKRPDAEEIFSSVTLDEIKKIVDNV